MNTGDCLLIGPRRILCPLHLLCCKSIGTSTMNSDKSHHEQRCNSPLRGPALSRSLAPLSSSLIPTTRGFTAFRTHLPKKMEKKKEKKWHRYFITARRLEEWGAVWGSHKDLCSDYGFILTMFSRHIVLEKKKSSLGQIRQFHIRNRVNWCQSA